MPLAKPRVLKRTMNFCRTITPPPALPTFMAAALFSSLVRDGQTGKSGTDNRSAEVSGGDVR